jgi:hypothetical protein
MQASMAIANRSAHATEEAAKAANLNAKAAIGVELPIVWIAKLELRRGPGIAGQIVGGDVPAEITPVLDFKNRGRTAAELRALSVQSEVTKARSKLSLSTSSNANFRLLPASIWKLTQHSQPEMEDSRSSRSPNDVLLSKRKPHSFGHLAICPMPIFWESRIKSVLRQMGPLWFPTGWQFEARRLHLRQPNSPAYSHQT